MVISIASATHSDGLVFIPRPEQCQFIIISWVALSPGDFIVVAYNARSTAAFFQIVIDHLQWECR